MSENDLIRRGDALDALARVGILPDDAAMDAIRALPADPVAEAAGKLVSLAIEALRCTDAHAVAWDAYETRRRAAHHYQDIPELEFDSDPETMEWPEAKAALRTREEMKAACDARDAALRAAVAARAKETA